MYEMEGVLSGTDRFGRPTAVDRRPEPGLLAGKKSESFVPWHEVLMFCLKEGGRSAFGSGTRRPLCASAGRPTPRTQEMRRTWASWGIS